MTDISVTRTDLQSENRAWYLGTPSNPGHVRNGTLDIAAFTEADHYPNGFIASGQPLGRITASGLYGPYDGAATDGRETAAGLLFSAATVPDSGANPGAAILVAFAAVDPDKLPVALDDAGQGDLALIYFET